MHVPPTAHTPVVVAAAALQPVRLDLDMDGVAENAALPPSGDGIQVVGPEAQRPRVDVRA